jgi:hypothetical protein
VAAFNGGAEAFVKAWNARVAGGEPRLEITELPVGDRLQSHLAASVLLTVDTDPSGRVESINLSIQPTTSIEDGALAIAAVEGAVRLADPSLDSAAAAGVLTGLGLTDVEDLSTLEGLRREIIVGDVKYWSIFVDLAGVDQDVLVVSADPVE